MYIPLKMTLLILLLYSLFTIVQGAINPCTEVNKYSTVTYKSTYQAYYKSCGFLGWKRCTRTRTMTKSVTTYYTQTDCCNGYSGNECIPICNPSCGTNKECSLPGTCTCVEGWKGTDCVTDINECLDGTDSCEEGCTNVNGSYSCFCYNNGTILANDGNRCLDSVNNVTANVGVNSMELAWLSPTNASDDGILSEYIITCTETNNTITTDTTQLTIMSLEPFTQYTCCIQPQWSTNGVGPSVCIQQKTLQDDGVELSIVKVCEELECDSVVSLSSIFSVSQSPGIDSSNIMNISNDVDGQERANNIKGTIYIVLYVIGPTILIFLILIIIIICIVKLKKKRTRNTTMVSESSPGIENPCYQSTIATNDKDKAKNDTASIYEDVDRYSSIKPYMMEKEVADYEICCSNTDKPHMPDSFIVQQAADYEETIFT